jgi:hypothetical protein
MSGWSVYHRYWRRYVDILLVRGAMELIVRPDLDCDKRVSHGKRFDDWPEQSFCRSWFGSRSISLYDFRSFAYHFFHKRAKSSTLCEVCIR